MPRSRLLPVVLLALPLLPGVLRAQGPAEIHGLVVERGGDPVPGAQILGGGVPGAVTDAGGRFRLVLEPGSHVVRVRAPGFASLRREVTLRPGERLDLVLSLDPAPVELEGIEIRGRAAAEGFRIGAAGIRRSGARNLGDVLRDVPGVTVVRRGPAGPSTLRIRGSAPDAVLVLVDGVPLNDPLTGEADLSALPASAIREVTVLAGARSATHGPRARAGVVVVETGRVAEPEVEGSVGSLGERSIEAAGGGPLAGGWWSAGGGLRTLDGGFSFRHAAEVGGGEGRRVNGDLTTRSARAGWRGPGAGGELALDLSGEELERGLPGRSFAPSLHARQDARRIRGALSWEGGVRRLSVDGALWGALQETRHRDPAPPVGLPYDDAARFREAGTRVDLEVSGSRLPLRLRGGAELRWQGVDAGALLEGAPRERVWGGAHAGAGIRAEELSGDPSATLHLRADRGPGGDLHLSHEARVALGPSGLRFTLAHRSAFSPPTLGDQYFRQGVAVVPNPALDAERVTGEWELGVVHASELSRGSLEAGLTGHLGDVDGLILWLPDFRFVWSPRNVDVRREGAEGWARWTAPVAPGGTVSFSGAWTWSRVTYRREALRGIQLPYRPEHAWSLGAAWSGRRGSLSLDARRVGTRYPRPARVNALDPFWEVDASLSLRLPAGGWTVEPALRVDRLLDQDASLIFGFPEPGRTFRLSVRVTRAAGRTAGASPSNPPDRTSP